MKSRFATNSHRGSDRPVNGRLVWLLLVVCGWLSSSGCTRYFYRKQADCEAFTVVWKKSRDPRWELLDYTVYSRPDSRFFDPTNVDRPPMPIDDVAAHKLMHCVDCKNGYPCWHGNGDTPFVANPRWKEFLPMDEQGVLELDMRGAVKLGYIHSRDYQANLEELYLSALDVAFERFRFDVQFFGTQGGDNFNQGENFQVLGPPAAGSPFGSSILTTTNALSANRFLASGGQFTTEILNTFMWQFAGPNQQNPLTIGSFSFVQPLLRLGSRALVLERLTLSERTLLSNVRALERYRQGFYVNLYNGRQLPQGPRRLGGLTGQAGLQGFTGVGNSGFGRIGGVGQTAPTGGGFTGGAGAAQANGFLGLLQDLVNIGNLEANVAGLRDSQIQLEAAYDAGRIDRFQVDLARQALFNAQSRLLTTRATFFTDLDGYKVLLGLPPDVPVRVVDPLLDRFQLLDTRLTRLQTEIGDLLDELRSPDVADETVEQLFARSLAARRGAAAHLAVVEQDFAALEANEPARLRDLDRLKLRSEAEGVQVGPLAYSKEAFLARVADLERDFGALTERFETTSALLQQLEQPVGGPIVDQNVLRRQLVKLVTEISGQMQELLLVQARARLDTVTLTPVELDHREALEIAREHRLDWMNARTSLVDTWRLIQFNANLLRGGLNIIVNGSLGTTPQQLLALGGSNGTLNVGMQFDAPLTRVAERNNYRQSLIGFQQARRAYMQFVDGINQSLRVELRGTRLNQLNFELRREAVAIAINQVDLTRLRLVQPPRPGETTQFSVTTARDLVDSLTNLLNVQTDFLSVWVNTEVQRANLDFELGTMLLDENGEWIDPGPITARLVTERNRVNRRIREAGDASAELPETPRSMDDIPGDDLRSDARATRAIPLTPDEVIAIIERDIDLDAQHVRLAPTSVQTTQGPLLIHDPQPARGAAAMAAKVQGEPTLRNHVTPRDAGGAVSIRTETDGTITENENTENENTVTGNMAPDVRVPHPTAPNTAAPIGTSDAAIERAQAKPAASLRKPPRDVQLVAAQEEAPLPRERVLRPVDLRPRKQPAAVPRMSSVDASAVDPSEAEEAPLPAE